MAWLMGKTEAMPERGGWIGGWCEGRGARGCRLLVKMGADDTGPVERWCALRDASVGVSTPDLNLVELAGEPGPDPQLLDVFAPR